MCGITGIRTRPAAGRAGAARQPTRLQPGEQCQQKALAGSGMGRQGCGQRFSWRSGLRGSAG